jgi:hypothetical protein
MVTSDTFFYLKQFTLISPRIFLSIISLRLVRRYHRPAFFSSEQACFYFSLVA